MTRAKSSLPRAESLLAEQTKKGPETAGSYKGYDASSWGEAIWIDCVNSGRRAGPGWSTRGVQRLTARWFAM